MKDYSDSISNIWPTQLAKNGQTSSTLYPNELGLSMNWEANKTKTKPPSISKKNPFSSDFAKTYISLEGRQRSKKVAREIKRNSFHFILSFRMKGEGRKEEIRKEVKI